jgi:hypothetical protein
MSIAVWTTKVSIAGHKRTNDKGERHIAILCFFLKLRQNLKEGSIIRSFSSVSRGYLE